jgi:hypothetical protein
MQDIDGSDPLGKFRLKERYFFEVPVYRLTEGDYQEQREKWVKARIYSAEKSEHYLSVKRSFHEKHPDKLLEEHSHGRKRYGGDWRYNEIIGFIRLWFQGTRVGCDYYRVEAKHIVRTRRKQFDGWPGSLAASASIPINTPSTGVYAIIRDFLERCARELPGRYIDLEHLDMLALYVDWSALYQRAMPLSAQLA